MCNTSGVCCQLLGKHSCCKTVCVTVGFAILIDPPPAHMEETVLKCKVNRNILYYCEVKWCSCDSLALIECSSDKYAVCLESAVSCWENILPAKLFVTEGCAVLIYPFPVHKAATVLKCTASRKILYYSEVKLL